MYLKIICQTPMRIKCFNYKYFFRQSPSPPQGKVRQKRFIGSWRKKKVPYQGSWKKVFEQTYSQQTDNKEQTGTLENLFSIQSLKISFIGFVIVPVMCILCFLQFWLLIFDLNLSFFTFWGTYGLFWGLGSGSESVLGSTHVVKKLVFFYVFFNSNF